MGKKADALAEQLAEVMERLTKAESRLDKQAKVIKEYQAKVHALEAQVSQGGQPTAGTNVSGVASRAVSEVSDQGWQMKPECLICGAAKEAGREKKLTCEECGRRYFEQSRREYKGERVMYDRCLSCGKAKKAPGPALQCKKCSEAFKAWKTGAA